MKVRETTSVQEHVVLTNIKALDLCVCECMYTHAITHTRSNCLVFSLFSFITYSRQNIMAVGFEAFMFSQSRRKFTNKFFSTEREHINASHHLACHSVRVSAMAKKLSLQEVLDHITDQENSGSIAGIEEETLTVKMHCKIYWKRKTSLNKLKTLQQLKRSNLLILRAKLKLM